MSTGRLTGNFPQAQETLRNDAVHLRDEVAAFCRRKGLLAYLQMAADLVKNCFSPKEIDFEVEVARHGFGRFL